MTTTRVSSSSRSSTSSPSATAWTPDAAMRATIEKFNELCDVITEIGNFRKLPNPPITGYEFHVIQLVSQVCLARPDPPYLKETLAEIKKRKPEPEFLFRARIVVVGSEIDDPEFTKLLEGCGAMVVADRYCFGSFPSRASASRSATARPRSTPSAATTCTGTSAPASWKARRSTSAMLRPSALSMSSMLTA